MDLRTAYAVLGLKPESSLDEAERLFDARAVRLDPNRVNRSLRPAAELAMAETNEAWDVVRQHLQSGGGPVTYEPAPLPEPVRAEPIAPSSELTSPKDAEAERGIASSAVHPESSKPIASVPKGYPPGWYPQPDGQQRYWEGQQWTEHFAPGAPAVTKPTVGAGRPWFKQTRFILPVIALSVIALAYSFNAGASSSKVAPAQPAASAQTQPDTPQAAAEPPASTETTAPSYTGDYDGAFGAFTAISKSGRGDATMILPTGVKAALVIATHSGSSNFQITGLDASNQRTSDGLVNEIGNYSGTTAYGLRGLGEPSVKLQIKADGAWTINVAPISSAAVLPATASGKGDTVFKFESGAVDVAITHKGSSNFQVQAYGSHAQGMGVNEIGNYSGTVPFVAGPSVVVIGADGTWTFQQQG